MNGKHLLGCFLFFIGLSSAFSQNRILYGTIRDGATGKPIPFVHVTIEGLEKEAMSDMEGVYTIPFAPGAKKLVFRAYMYLESEVEIGTEDSLNAYLFYAHPFSFQTITSPKTRQLISQITRVRNQIDPRKEKNYQYQSYNKVVLTTQYVSALKLHLDHLLALFGKQRLAAFGGDHHILMMESASERDYKSRFQQKEKVIYSHISGINQPPGLSLVSGFEPFSIFEPFLRIGTKKYISPLAGRPNKRYIFFVLDTIRTENQEIFVVKFNPRPGRNKELLQGILYISQNPVGVVAFQVWPAFDMESKFSLMQQSVKLPSGRWFPSQIKTSYQREKLGGLKIPVEASSKTYIFNFEDRVKKPGEKFNEIIFDFQKDSLKKFSGFPPSLRQERLTEKDKNTFVFFQKVGSMDGIDRYLNFGQKIFSGRIPFGRVDLVFRKAFTVNDVEGLRFGLGLQSTEKWSLKHQGGGYFAYGTKDQRIKFGMNYQYNFNPIHSASMAWQTDLAEPGSQSFAFPKPQYPTEQLRNIRIPRFDAINHLEISHLGHWRPNLDTKTTLDLGKRQYLYAYNFLPDSGKNSLGISEVKATLRWSPGEQFAKYEHEKISLGSPYPTFWLQVSQGLKGLQPNSYSYSRLEVKGQWTKRILGIGEIGIQVQAGIVAGDIPYPLLFTARGSFKDVSFLSYNSFETMRYNEFINDRFVQVFFSHKFSRMQISTLPFRPYFTFIQNMGWGSLKKPGLHSGITFSDMPKGYMESGLFLNDLFVIPLAGIYVGIGAGAFVRYGPYALESNLDNLAIKFSTTFSL